MKLNTKAKLIVAAVAATMMLGGASSAQAATPVSPSLPAVGHIYCWETGDYIWLTETSASWTKQDGATLKTVPRAQYDAVAPSQEWRLTANGCVFYPRGGTVGGQPHK